MSTPFKMKGMDFGNSPVKQDKTVPVSGYEKSKGTMSGSKGDSNSEKINSIESRIFNLREDLKGGSTGKPSVIAIGKTITKLEAELKKLRAK
tara:strand:- start:393 stop:668 length:276 start_codon:yes stop_codon:yes gene_type:complete